MITVAFKTMLRLPLQTLFFPRLPAGHDLTGPLRPAALLACPRFPDCIFKARWPGRSVLESRRRCWDGGFGCASAANDTPRALPANRAMDRLSFRTSAAKRSSIGNGMLSLCSDCRESSRDGRSSTPESRRPIPLVAGCKGISRLIECPERDIA
jgi:hypothetical protein